MLIPVWENELGWARTATSGGSSLVLAIMALSSPFAGNLLDRYGPRPVLAGGLILLGGAILATSQIDRQWQFLVWFGLVGGFGYGALSLPLVSTAVALYFDRNRGIATSIAMSGSTGGQLPVLILLGFMTTTIGWRGAYVVFGVALLLLVPVTLVMVRRRQDNAAPEPSRDGTRDTLSHKLRFLGRDRTFLLLLGAFTLCGFTTSGVIDVHFVPYAVASGYPLVDGTAAYGVHGLFNMFGLLLAGFLSDRVNRPRLLAGIFFVRSLSFVLLLFMARDISLMYVFAAIFGLLNFAVLPLIASLVASHIGVRIMGLTMGLLFGGHSLGGAVGALMGGYFFDWMGHYHWVWIISVGGAFAAGVFTIMISETRGEERPSAPAPMPI